MLHQTEVELLERAIDLFLLNLPEHLAQLFELDGDLYFVLENLQPWDDKDVAVLIIECPEPDICKLMLRNLQTVARAAATCGIRYFSVGEDGDDALIFQSFFSTPSCEIN